MLPNLTGQILGKYRIVERLGHGENAAAYKAIQVGLDRPVTLKVLLAADPDCCEMLRRESVTLARFRHPGIRQVFGIEASGSVVYAVLEYAEGTLRALISSRLEQHRPFSKAEVVRLLRPIADVVDYLHRQGWVHLDIKPENVMLMEGQRIALADFGIAQPFGKARNPGTPGYASPEALTGEVVGPPADIFSLAAVAYEMFTGTPPFQGAPIERIAATRRAAAPRADRIGPSCSNSVGFVLKEALARNPQQRSPGSAGALADLLDRADTLTVRLPSLPRRRPVLVSGMGAAVCVALGLGFWRPWASQVSSLSGSRPAASMSRPAPEEGIDLVASVTPANSSWTARPAAAASTPLLPVSAATRAPSAVPTMTLAPTRSPVPSAAPTLPVGPACTNDEWVEGAVIRTPQSGAKLKRSAIAVRGTADLPGMTEYELYVHDATLPADTFAWRDSRPEAVRDGLLWTWEAETLDPGPYVLRLRVKLNNGQYKQCDVPVTLE